MKDPAAGMTAEPSQGIHTTTLNAFRRKCNLAAWDAALSFCLNQRTKRNPSTLNVLLKIPNLKTIGKKRRVLDDLLTIPFMKTIGRKLNAGLWNDLLKLPDLKIIGRKRSILREF